MVTEISKASSGQVREVLRMLLEGVSSDVSSMEAIAGSWWRRPLFLYWFGPRFLGKQMDTFVATADESIIGFVIVQYDGDAAGTFDWAYVRPLEKESNRAEFADLIDTALDFVEGQGIHPYFYFGFATESPPEVRQVLEEIGLSPADYQTTQMVGALPLEESPSIPDGFRLSPQFTARFGPRLTEFLPALYQDAPAEEIEMLAAIHTNTIRSSKIFLVMEGTTELGFVQQFRWRDELRLLLALPRRLWGSETERQLVAYMAQAMQGQNERLRLRTFSKDHLAAAKDSLSSLGLTWEEAPWQRWVVALEPGQEQAVEGNEAEEPESRYGSHGTIWPPQAAQQEPGGAASDSSADEEQQEDDGNDGRAN
ncbi:MAG: hypothetical protein OXF62_14725 [Caldilineaceae bacterium]|nr:hypothetical protein [Caldilineaceae bacterium]